MSTKYLHRSIMAFSSDNITNKVKQNAESYAKGFNKGANLKKTANLLASNVKDGLSSAVGKFKRTTNSIISKLMDGIPDNLLAKKMTEAKLIQGAHLISVEKDGSDHVGNGLPLCANHHLAMDNGLVAVHPESFQIVVRKGKEGLGVTRESIKGHLNNLPDPECLRYVWNEHKWNKKI